MRGAVVVAGLTLVSLRAHGDARHLAAFDAAKLEDACLEPVATAVEEPVGNGAVVAVAPTCKVHALAGFAAAMAAATAGSATHPVRIAYFGDSLTADDQITNALRKRLQGQLGDGGPGFVWIVPPHPFNQHRAMARGVAGEWTVGGVSTVVPGDRLLGLGGSAESADGDVRFAPSGAFSSIDVHYLVQPHGGSLEILADGKSLATIPTAGAAKKAAFQKLDIAAGTKRIDLRTAHGNVRMFGAAFETKTGAIVDNLGVVNATAKAFAHNNMDEHWKNQLAHRAADLVVIMLGTNEAEWLHRGAGMLEHEKIFDELLATVRAANPSGSCLVISPLDQLDWRDEKMPPRDSIPAMVEAQHRSAVRHGCAFWDTYAWMGGKGSSMTWYKRGLVVKDFQHPTSEGAELIADALYRGLTNK